MAASSTNPQKPISNDVIVERLENLAVVMGEVKELVKTIDARQREIEADQAEFREQYIRQHEPLVASDALAHRRIDAMEAMLKEFMIQVNEDKKRRDENDRKLETAIYEMKSAFTPVVKVVVWIAGIFVTSVLGLLFMILTHQVTVAFP